MGRMQTPKAILRKSLAVLTASIIAVSSGTLLSASDASADQQSSEQSIDGGSLIWGINEGWRNYVSGPIAGGKVEPVEPATRNDDNSVTWKNATGQVNLDQGSGTIKYSGGMRSLGHMGYVTTDEYGLDQTLSDLEIELTSPTTATLSAVVDQTAVLAFQEYTNQRVDIADLEFSQEDLRSGSVAADATFTAHGAAIYAEMNDNYKPGAEVDQVRFTIEANAKVPEGSKEPDSSSSTDDLPSPTEKPATDTTDNQKSGSSGVQGKLEWGLKQSFRSYVRGPIAGGKITASGGAQQLSGNGAFTFPQASSGTTWNGSSGKVQYAGNVNFYGHDGVMDVTLSNPRVVIEDSNSAKLQTQFQGETITLATIDLSGAAREDLTGDAVRFTGAPVTLHSQGVEFFAHNGQGFYKAGEELDRLNLTVGAGSEISQAATPPSSNSNTSQSSNESSTTTPIPTAADASAAGSMKWPVSDYFAAYTTAEAGSSSCPTPSGHCAGGQIETSGVGEGWVFPQATGGDWDDETQTGTVNFSGLVAFKGYGMTMFEVSNPSITVSDDATATLQTGNSTSHGEASYSLDLAAGTKTENGNGSVTWSNVSVNGSLAGISASQSIDLEPLTFTVGTPNEASFGASASGSGSDEESQYEAADTPPTTDGLEVLTDPEKIREGGRIKVRAEGFEAEDSGVLAVLYEDTDATEPIVLDDTAKADADGVVEWSGTLPDGATGDHVMTLQGSSDAGAEIDIQSAQATAATGAYPEDMGVGERLMLAMGGMEPWEWWASAGSLLSIAGCSSLLTLRHRRSGQLLDLNA